MSELVTIFTPTYNRAHLLPRLYDSLKKQTKKDFVWLVVDDGSVDDTQKLIQGWVKDGDILIQYCHKQNGGKMRAHNMGVRICNTELFMCLDSDDYLSPNCIERIYSCWNSLKEKDNVSGIVAYRNMIGQTPSYFPDKQFATLKEINKVYKGETALVFRTQILKSNLFPEFDGEKFIGEGVVYSKLDAKYVLAVVPEYWIECEYQEGGLTDSALKLLMNNPKGWALNAQTKYLYNAESLKEKIKYTSTYICASLVARKSLYRIIIDFPNKILCFSCLLLGLLQKIKNDRQVKVMR